MKIFAKHFIHKPRVLLVAVVLFLSATEAFAASHNLLTTFNSYSPASQTYCGSAVDIDGTWNFINANCGGNPAPNYTITWYYNTTNSTIVAGATQVQQTTGNDAAPPTYTLLAANIAADPPGPGVTYYYFHTAIRASGCGPSNPTSQPSITATVTDPGGNMSYSSTTTGQTTTLVPVNTTDNDIISVQVITTGACSPFDATSFTFVITGTTLASDITNAKLYWTGNTSTFSTGTQLDATLAVPPASPTTFTFSGFSQTLAGGTDYFLLERLQVITFL